MAAEKSNREKRRLLRKILSRSRGELGCFLEAFLVLCVVRVGLTLLAFRHIGARLGPLRRETPFSLPPDLQGAVRRVGWAVESVARNVPLGFVCLPQAITAKWMLGRRGISSTLYLGVRLGEPGFAAHAWLRAGEMIVTGRRESRRHKVVASFGDFSVPPGELLELLALLRMALGSEPAHAISIADPSALNRFIGRHRVGAFLHRRLPDAVRLSLPESVQHTLENQARANALRGMALCTELTRVAGEFAARQIPFVAIKGPLLARDLFKDVGTRHAGDLDLLIAPADLANASAVLEQLGYRRTRPQSELTPVQLRHYAEKEYEFCGGRHDLRIELAWKIDGIGGLSRAECQTVEWQGSSLETLSGEWNALYLFQHGSRHAWRRLFWLIDVAVLLQRRDMDWPGIVRRARKEDLHRPVFEGAALAAQLLGLTLPGELTPDFPEQTNLARLVREAKRQMMESDREFKSLTAFFRDVLHRMRLHPRWPRKLQELAPHLHSARNWNDLPLPDSMFWLYIPLAPLLWMRRRLKTR